MTFFPFKLPPDFDSSIVDVSPPIPRTDHREKLVNRNDPSGNENILLCNYVFVPVDNPTEYLLLEAIWHGRWVFSYIKLSFNNYLINCYEIIIFLYIY
jgi:hypothetical protein